jgi:hypothetical protein
MTGAIVPPDVYVSALADSGFGGGIFVIVDSFCVGNVNNARKSALFTAVNWNRNGGGPTTFRYGLLPDHPRAPDNPIAIATMIALTLRAVENLLIRKFFYSHGIRP